MNFPIDRPYQCPDCHRRHDEPATAAYALLVRCLDCEFEEHDRLGSGIAAFARAA